MQCKQKWLHHVNRMEDIRDPKQFLDYQPTGHKDIDNHLRGYRTNTIVRMK